MADQKKEAEVVPACGTELFSSGPSLRPAAQASVVPDCGLRQDTQLPGRRPGPVVDLNFCALLPCGIFERQMRGFLKRLLRRQTF